MVLGLGWWIRRKHEVLAHITNDERFGYYIFKCTKEPTKADEDTVFHRDGNNVPVKEGKWYCDGMWMDKITGTSNCYVDTSNGAL